MASSDKLPEAVNPPRHGPTFEPNMQRSVHALLIIAPWLLSYIVQWLTHDKKLEETYAEYMVRKGISPCRWKKMTRFPQIATLFETTVETKLGDFDVTSLNSLLLMLFRVSQSDSNRNFDKIKNSLDKVVKTRNILHTPSKLGNPDFLIEIKEKLLQLLDDARVLCSISDEKYGEIKKNLTEMFAKECTCSHQKKELTENIATFLVYGKPYNMEYIRKIFACEYPMITNDVHFKTEEIFYDPKILLGDTEKSYTKLLENTHQFVILTGEPGSGKTTLLKNLALKFHSPNSSEISSLEEWDLLVYYDCQDIITKTFLHIVQNNFKDACEKINDGSAVRALQELKVIYLVDAFDEISKNSAEALEELIVNARCAESRVIITTRPCAAHRLKSLLAKKSVLFSPCKLSPLTNLNDKKNFLMKYQKSFKSDRDNSGLVGSFLRMKPALIALFDLPIHLVHYCDIYWHSQGARIKEWKSFFDFSANVVRLYEEQVTSRLINKCIPHLDLKIRDLFHEVGRVALQKVAVNSVSFTSEEEKNLRERCLLQVENVEASSFLSVLLKEKRRLGSDDVIHVFRHKSIAEKLAGNFLTRELVKENEVSFEKLLSDRLPRLFSKGQDVSLNPTHPLEPIREVVLNIIRTLSASHPQDFEHRFPELKKATEGLFKCSEWQEVMQSSPDVAQLAEIAFTTTLKEEGKFVVKSNRDAEAVALMLPYFKDHYLVIQMRLKDVNLDTWRRIVSSRLRGVKLHIRSVDPYEDCTEFLLPLHNVECRLEEFEGCLAKQEAVDALASIAYEATELRVRLPSPVMLSATLKGKYKKLWVYTRVIDVPESSSSGPSAGSAFAVPDFPPPTLQVDYAPEGSKKAVAHTIRTFAPTVNRYGGLRLWRERLSGVEIDDLLVALQRSGVRTQNAGRTRSISHGDGTIGLIVTDSPFVKLTPEMRIVDVILSVTEIHAPERWRQLKQEVTVMHGQDTVPPNLWHLIIEALDDDVKVAELAAKRMIEEDGRLTVHSDLTGEAIIRMLPHARETELDVRSTPGDDMCLKESTWRQLIKFLSEDTVLSLDLRGGPHNACDHLLCPVGGSRCHLSSFRGTIRTMEAVEALASIASDQTVVHIWMQTPLSLGSRLEGKCLRLYIYTPPFDATLTEGENTDVDDDTEGASLALQLPVHPPSRLQIDAQHGSPKSIVHTVLSLAPPSKRFRDLSLEGSHLDMEEKHQLLRDLYNAGIRTRSSGDTCFSIDKEDYPILLISDTDPELVKEDR